MLYVRQKRERAGLSQAALAARVDVTPAAVSYWESGRKQPTADKLPLLAEALDCGIDALFRDDEPDAQRGA